MYKNKFRKYNNKINQIMHGGAMSIVDDWKLLLTSFDNAEDINFLLENNIKHVVSVLHNENLNPQNEKPRYRINKHNNINYQEYIIADLFGGSEWVNDVLGFGYEEKLGELLIKLIEKLFELYMYKIANFIEICKVKNENVLIHCRSAVSRSPSVIIGYYIIKKNISSNDARNLLVKKTGNQKFQSRENALWGYVLQNIEKNNQNQNILTEINDEINELLRTIFNSSDVAEILNKMKENINNNLEKDNDPFFDKGLYDIIENYAKNTNQIQ